MKLLFFIHGLSGGGAERVLSTIASAFVDRGHSVRVVYTEYLKEKAYTIDSRIEEIQLFNVVRKKRFIERAFSAIVMKTKKYGKIRKQVSEYKPDVAISFLTQVNNDVIISLIGKNVPLIVCEHSRFSRYYGIRTNFSRWLLYRFATAITVLTKKDYDGLTDKYSQIYYMPNPITIPENKGTMVQREKVVLAAGRVHDWYIKGFDNFLRCWGNIKDDYPGWVCRIAGHYSEEDLMSLKEVVPSESLERVEFLGFRDDVHEVMRGAEVFCLTSRVEGFGLVLAEAMTAGCCCVSFDVENGPSEIIEDGKSGLLVKNQDLKDLEQKLRLVMSNEELRHKYSNNAPKSIERYSLSNTLDRWNMLLMHVTGKSY